MKITSAAITTILYPLMVLVVGGTNAVQGEELSTPATNLRRSLNSLKSPKSAKASKSPKSAKASKSPKTSKVSKSPKSAKASKSPFKKASALLEIDLNVFGEVHPAKMDIGH